MRKSLLFLVVAAATAAVALPALAASPTTTTTGTTTTKSTTPPAKAHSHWFAGAVSSVDSGTLTIGVLWTRPHDGSLNGTAVTVSVDASTEITYGQDKIPIQLSSLQNGDLVGVVASGSNLSSLTAQKIHAFCNCHWIGGTISSLGSSSLTVQVKRTGPYYTVLADHAVTIQTSSSTTYIRGKDKTPIQLSDLKAGDGVGVIFAANGFFRAPGFDPRRRRSRRSMSMSGDTSKPRPPPATPRRPRARPEAQNRKEPPSEAG
jgi:hypothetical protein